MGELGLIFVVVLLIQCLVYFGIAYGLMRLAGRFFGRAGIIGVGLAATAVLVVVAVQSWTVCDVRTMDAGNPMIEALCHGLSGPLVYFFAHFYIGPIVVVLSIALTVGAYLQHRSARTQ